MANVGEKAENQLRDIAACPNCTNVFTDPRMLPCIGTLCVECLKRTAEEAHMNPGDIFLTEDLLKFKTAQQVGSDIINCDMCHVRNEGKTEQMPTATMRCLECRDRYGDSCLKVHDVRKSNKSRELVANECDTTKQLQRPFSILNCPEHTLKPLDCYCVDCKKILCATCLVESHKSHCSCKDIETVSREFCQAIEKSARKISNCADEMLSRRNTREMKMAHFIQKIVETENEIRTKSQELKDVIEQHTKSLLNELSVIRSNHVKAMENEMEEIERCCTTLKSFEAYCTELATKGSASDICSSVDQLIIRGEELEKDHEVFAGRPHQAVKVSFQAASLKDILQESVTNVVGIIKETKIEFESYAVVLGLDDDPTAPNDIIKINLHRSNTVSIQENIPADMELEAVAAVYSNTMYVAGIGHNFDEIWKYKMASGWNKCGSLLQGRRRHCAAFINDVLYVCGGVGDIHVARRKNDSTTQIIFGCEVNALVEECTLDSVEAYNAVTNECRMVGKLLHSVHSAGNCVPYRRTLYIFGGADEYHSNVRHVQMFDTERNICTLLTTQMPRPLRLQRAVLWETSVILLGRDTSFIFNIETETWEEREQFKTDVVHFGLVLENERVFVIGGGNKETGKCTWKCRNDVRYVPLRRILEDKPTDWKIHSQLPKPCLVQAYVRLGFLV